MSEQLTHVQRRRAQACEEILHHARRLLAKGGPEAVVLRTIAAHMGVTGPALRRYVRSRDELLRRLADETYAALQDHLAVADEARLHHMWWDWIEHNHHHAQLLLSVARTRQALITRMRQWPAATASHFIAVA